MKGRQENKIVKKGKDISEQFKGNGKCEVICEKNKKTTGFLKSVIFCWKMIYIVCEGI